MDLKSMSSIAISESVNADADSSKRVWYPCEPPVVVPVRDMEDFERANPIMSKADAELPPPHPIWSQGQLKYITSNRWQSIPNEKRIACQRHRIHGVEVRTLPSSHFLAGECGLFATQKFSRFDVLGEYTGKIVGSDVCGHYVAALEDKGSDESLGIDAQTCGSELRFINSYLNVAFKANVSMRTAYINTYPHIIIVCTEDIDVGDEFLLDYGEGYNSVFLKAKPVVPKLDPELVRKELPGFASDSSSESSDDD